MAKLIHNDVFDAALEELATCTNLTFCSAQPANYAGIAAVSLVATTITAGSAGADYTIADGDVSGRKLTITAQTGLTPSNASSENVLWCCIDDGVTLLGVTSVTSQAVIDTETWDSPAVDILEIKDPA